MKKSLFTKLFAVAAMELSCVSAWAVMPQAGKVYRIVNKNYGTSVADFGPTYSVGCSDINETNMSQRWLVSAGAGSALRFQSLGTGKYLTSSRARSQGWRLGEATNTSAQLIVTGTDGDYAVKCSGDGDHLAMHCDGQGVVVCWDASIDPSKWDFIEIAMTQSEINAALDVFKAVEAEVAKESAYQTTLGNIFDDAACTIVKSSYQSMNETQLAADANYKALSAPLQAMVRKSIFGDWTESYATIDGRNVSWDTEHAKKYRVQLYEPYSEGAAAANLAGIQAYTNMNNPTGIIGNTGDVLYVMVDGEIKPGATLYMGSVTGYGMFNNCTDGVQLHQGLNLVPIYSDLAHQFIYYTVETTEWRNGAPRPTPIRKLTEFDDIKIHIEGGQLNGFFNLTGDALYKADTDADYRYTAERAQHPMYDLLGKYVILHFFFFDTKASAEATSLSWGLKKVLDPAINAGTNRCFDVPTIMKTWDDLCFRERTLMGIQSDEELAQYNDELLWGYYEPLTGDKIDKHPAGSTYNTDPGYQYSEYFNNRMMGITMQGSLYMNATSWRTAYNISTMTDILNLIPNEAGPMWGPAHEYGHMNQGPMKMAGTTEESNNIFSNVCVYYHNKSTSRADMPKDQLNIFNQDKTYLENGVWGTTRMFLQLWLYYHACGNNKKFYPRLYELLRNNPRQQSYYLDMRKDHLQFVRMCCLAAQEDLTDYFDSWGFFVPLDNYHIGDYSNFMATLTQKDIDEVKAEIKSWGLPVNHQIINIDDRPGSTRPDWAEYMSKKNAGALGGLDDFRNKVTPSGSMTCTMRNDSLVVNHTNGSAGTGFVIIGEDGTLLGFSNDYSFPLKKAATAALMQGKATVYAVGAEGTKLEVVNDYRNAPISEHISNLRKLIESTADVYGVIDSDETHAGWYRPFYARSFLSAYNAATEAADNPSSATVDIITELYLNLLNEYNILKESDSGKVPFIPGSVYKLFNSRFPTHVLASNTTKATFVANKSDENDADLYQRWEFQTVSAADNTYRLYNQRWNRYLGKPDTENNSVNGTLLSVVEKRTDAGIFTLNEIAPGKYVLLDQGDWGYAIHANGEQPGGSIGLRGTEYEASYWILQLVEAHETNGAKAKLQQLIDEATDLLAEAGTIAIEGNEVNLQEDMFFSNARSHSGENVFTSFNVLIDNDILTFFHTNTDNDVDSDDGLDHYIGVDLGEGNSLTSFQVNWTNRDVARNGEESSDDENAPKVNNPIRMRVEGSADGVNYTAITQLNSLPSGSGASYASDVITDGNPYRFIRLVCVFGAGMAYKHPYFAMSEFGISDAAEIARPKEIYPNVEPDMMIALRDQLAASNADINTAQTRPDRYISSYNALLTVFQALADAMGVETVIEEVAVDRPETTIKGIYDLQGRRLHKATKGNVYIIDGVKTFVR